MTPPPRLFRVGLGIATAVILLDQISKWVMLDWLSRTPFIEVTGFLNFVAVWNRGISFGLFDGGADSMRWVLIAVALAITAALTWWLRTVDKVYLAVVIGLIIGGALGNVIDRVRFGAVFDFIDFHVFGYHWYTFNVADSAISVGVVLLLIDSVFGPRPDESAEGKAGEGDRSS